jgi:hypothetical protein
MRASPTQFLTGEETMSDVKDLTGQRFRSLTVIRYHEESKRWECLCDCGKTTMVAASSLKSGNTGSCGCQMSSALQRHIQSIQSAIDADLAGKRFGKLTAIRYKETRNQSRYWECLCDCGRTTAVRSALLKNGNTKSCGCHKRSGLHRTHGLSRVPEFRIWFGIVYRCYDKRAREFKYYGGRGIIMSYEWYISFENFLRDMGPRPGPEYTVERLDNNGPYAKWNCKWATRMEQMQNTRFNTNLTFNGQTMCLTQWARELNIHPATLHNRIRKHWPLEMVLTSQKFRARAFQSPKPR